MTKIIFGGLFLFAADRLTKYWAKTSLEPGLSYSLWPDFFKLTLVYNPGGAFGLFPGSPVLLVGAAFLALLLLLILFPRFTRNHWAIALVCAGALGNLYDRIVYGSVIDFIDLSFWPVFNLADVAITAGGLVLAYELLTNKEKRAKQHGHP